MTDHRNSLHLTCCKDTSFPILYVDNADNAATRDNRYRQHRLVCVFGKFSKNLEAWVVRNLFGNDNRLAVLGHPSGNSLPYLHLEPIYDFRMRILGGAKHQVIVFQHEYEAGVTTYQIGDEFDDLVEHLVQRICRRDASAEIMQEI